MTENASTRVFAVIMGLWTGISAIPHGVAEIAQGNVPATDILTRVGAFTIIPNYLISGIVTILLSVWIIIWCVGFLQKKHGPWVYLLSSITLFFVGGGVAFLVFMAVTFWVSTQINKPLGFWKQRIPDGARQLMKRLWLPALVLGYLMIGVGVMIWLFLLPPGVIHSISHLHYVCWFSLLSGIGLLLLTVVLGFARDLELRTHPATLKGTGCRHPSLRHPIGYKPAAATRGLLMGFGVEI